MDTRLEVTQDVTTGTTYVGKTAHLSPEGLAEVEDFIDFLNERDRDKRLRQDYAKVSEETWSKVWDNDEDAVYDTL